MHQQHQDITADKLANFRRALVRPPGSRNVLVNEAAFLRWARGEDVTGQEEGRLIPVPQWNRFHIWPTLPGLRWLIFKSSSPEALVKAMRRPRSRKARAG